MKRTQNKNRKRLHLIALILGIYAGYLGSGLILVSLDDMGEAVGSIRLLLGMGMAGLGLFGIWDGVRDIIWPPAKHAHKPPTQYILTDVSGNRTSNVTAEMIRGEIGKLRDGERDSFHLELLTPLDVPKWGTVGRFPRINLYVQTIICTFQSRKVGLSIWTHFLVRHMHPRQVALRTVCFGLLVTQIIPTPDVDRGEGLCDAGD